MNIYIKSAQHGGATLLFVLVVLIIITVLGLASARNTLLQERMASITGGHNAVLQVAEAALTEIEELIVTTDSIEFRKNFQQNDCQRGYCPLGRPVATPLWMTNDFWKDKNKIGQSSKRPVAPFGDIIPRYVIEDLGQSRASCDPSHIDITLTPDCPLVPGQWQYRITVLAQVPQGISAMVQSTFFDPHMAVK